MYRQMVQTLRGRRQAFSVSSRSIPAPEKPRTDEPAGVAPADVAIEHETKLFQNGFSYKKTPYQEDPSPEVDDLWRHLYYSQL